LLSTLNAKFGKEEKSLVLQARCTGREEESQNTVEASGERERNGKEPNTENVKKIEITSGGNSAKKSHLSVITYMPINSFMNSSPDWRIGLKGQ
jgi:hypothetical protein